MYISNDKNNFRNEAYLKEMDKEFKRMFRAFHKYIAYRNKLMNELTMSEDDVQTMLRLDKKFVSNSRVVGRRIKKADFMAAHQVLVAKFHLPIKKDSSMYDTDNISADFEVKLLKRFDLSEEDAFFIEDKISEISKKFGMYKHSDGVTFSKIPPYKKLSDIPAGVKFYFKLKKYEEYLTLFEYYSYLEGDMNGRILKTTNTKNEI